VGTLHLAFLIIHERQNLIEEFIALTTEEFVVGHMTSTVFKRVTAEILDPLVGRFKAGQVANSA
jgi:hypothetical protein